MLTLVVLAVIVALAVVGALFVFRADRERPLLVGTYVIAGIAGWLIATIPGGISDSDADYLGRFFLSLAAGTLGGITAGLLRGRRLASYAAAGFGGGATFIVGVAGLVFGWLAVTGACIG